MDLRQVEYVIAVSEELAFTRAARRCGVSQPTITSAIQKLERELGRPMFHRKPDVRLTEFGRRVVSQFYRIRGICDAIAAMAAAPGGGGGTAESAEIEARAPESTAA